MSGPRISVIIPARNESTRIAGTIRSIANARSTNVPCEIIVVDDASRDGWSRKLCFKAPNLNMRVLRSKTRLGVAGARNFGAMAATGEILVFTDAHVRFGDGWDRLVSDNVAPKRIIAATITDRASGFRGNGCSLVVPFMGTRWNRASDARDEFVHIASSAGTALLRDLFWQIGGYDVGMVLYGAAEPEFSVRAWLSGAQIRSVSKLEVAHRFKSRAERQPFLRGLRSVMVHNNLRFGLLYLSDSATLQALRHYAAKFPRHMPKACAMLDASDVWQRRTFLEGKLKFAFPWFVSRFGLKDQVGGTIL